MKCKLTDVPDDTDYCNYINKSLATCFKHDRFNIVHKPPLVTALSLR